MSGNVVRLALWPGALAAGGLTAAAILTSDVVDSPRRTAALGLLVGLSWCAAGLVEWRRRPGNRTGPLMVFFGFAWFGSLLERSDAAPLFTSGSFLTALFFAVLGHVLLAFPSGRLDRLSRALVTAGYIDTTAVVAASVLFRKPEADEPTNLALVTPNATLADAFKDTARGIGVALLVAGIIVLARRWRYATPRWRRAVALVFWTGAAAGALAALTILTKDAGKPLGAITVAFFLVLAAVPLALTVDVLRGKLARIAVADLVIQLRETHPPGKLRDALAYALHDPSLSLAYWIPERRRYVDVAGRPVELPAEGDSQVVTVVEREGRRVAALVHDAALRDEPELVEAVRAAAGLALENERLQADLRARLDDLRASRVRMVEAAEAERRRLERNLHDGTQQRLVSISMALGLAESRLRSDPDAARRIIDEARLGLGAALHELRELSQGIHPGVLTERGLGPALEELAYLAPMPVELAVPVEERLPEPVEAAAYYVVAEALANVAKYASAGAVSITVQRQNGTAIVEVADDGVGGADPSRGSGLRGLSDRVEALGGTLAVESRPGAGTKLKAEIPCAS
jgi:signal transduction histidine kinase